MSQIETQNWWIRQELTLTSSRLAFKLFTSSSFPLRIFSSYIQAILVSEFPLQNLNCKWNTFNNNKSYDTLSGAKSEMWTFDEGQTRPTLSWSVPAKSKYYGVMLNQRVICDREQLTVPSLSFCVYLSLFSRPLICDCRVRSSASLRFRFNCSFNSICSASRRAIKELICFSSQRLALAFKSLKGKVEDKPINFRNIRPTLMLES